MKDHAVSCCILLNQICVVFAIPRANEECRDAVLCFSSSSVTCLLYARVHAADVVVCSVVGDGVPVVFV